MIALSLRPVNIIGFWTLDPEISNMDWVQQGAKLCVGIVQDWVTMELALRSRIIRRYGSVPQASIRRLRTIFNIFFLVLILAFIAWIIAVIVSAHQPGNEGYAFFENFCQAYDLVGYLFLGQVIVMGSLVIWLFIETRKEYSLRKELCVFATVSAFFALSYIGRCINNEFFCGYYGNAFFGNMA